MKNRIILASILVLLALAVSAWAADVAGKWTAHVPAAQGQGGDSDITFVFKVADGKLTGTINNSQQAGDVEIQDGKVEGDDISFSLKRNIQGADLTVVWKGKISGDEIKFTRSTEGGRGAGAPGGAAAGGRGGAAATEIVAKRAK
jgi:hypothetical protein